MKAKILNIEFGIRFGVPKCTVCRITFEDPYCRNVKRCVIGVAKCNPNDTFDRTLGQRIAEGRAKRAMFQKLYNSAENLKHNLKFEMWIQYNRNKRETEHINKLLNNYYNEQQDNKKA